MYSRNYVFARDYNKSAVAVAYTLLGTVIISIIAVQLSDSPNKWIIQAFCGAMTGGFTSEQRRNLPALVNADKRLQGSNIGLFLKGLLCMAINIIIIAIIAFVFLKAGMLPQQRHK